MMPSMESSPRPIASEQNHMGLTLDEVFGTRGQVHLLRILSTETEGSIASTQVASRTGMTPSGVRKALRRLARAGVLEKVGTGRKTRYVLRRDGRLAQEIARLFEMEKRGADPGWKPAGVGATYTGEAAATGHGIGHQSGIEEPAGTGAAAGNGTGAAAGNGHGNGNGNGKGTNLEATHLNPASPEFHNALVSLLEEDLSLIRRARERVQEKLHHRHSGNGHDLWEWRKILDTYPLPRLLHFLESDSPRALRLRESSPFPEVMSEAERERLGKLVERVH